MDKEGMLKPQREGAEEFQREKLKRWSDREIIAIRES